MGSFADGMKPVFCDIDEYLCIDPVDMLSRITEKTKAVIFVGLGGNVGQLERVKQICTEKGLVLILDAAHMAGTRLHGKHVGHDVDCTVFSFQAVKNLATADSGMICFNDPQRDERARKLTWLGINKDTYARTVNQGSYKWMYEVEELGFKYHGNSIMASMALVSLYYLDRDNSYRRQLAEWYREEIGNDKRINVVPIAPGCESSTHLLQIRVKHRDLVLAGLNELDIHPGVHYRDNTEYALYKSEDNVRQKSREASSEVLSLPMHMNVTKRNVEEIVNGLKKTLDKLDQ